nr:immunoglobulin light chain junction region [Macaca mulatta]MOV35203.1 immunoglobulin light chain junction region [Macaca mulatta]
CQQYNSVPLTF